MEKHPQENLEALIHRELAKLSPREAPETLVPHVLARIQAQHCRRWWQRPWSQWPLGPQVAAVPLMMASVTAALWSLSALWDWVVLAATGRVSSSLAPFAALGDVLLAFANVAMVLLRAAGVEWLLAVLFVPLLMYLVCVGLGTLAYRMAAQSR